MLLRRLARPMIAAVFIQGGINNIRFPAAHAQAAKPVLDAVAPAVEKAADMAPIEQRPDDEMLIKIEGGVKIAAGTLLALSRCPRLAATTLAATLIPTTMAAHRFWEEDDAQRKQEHQIHFLKNLSMFGGLLIAAADTGGKPSLGWKSRRAAKLAAGATAAKTGAITGAATDVTGRVTGAAQGARGKVSGGAREARGKAAGLTAGLAGIAPGAGAAASERVRRAESQRRSRASEISAEWSRRAAKAQRKAEKHGKLEKAAAKKQGKAVKRPDKQAPAVLDQAGRFGHDIATRATTAGGEVAHQAAEMAKDARQRAAALTHH